MISSPSQDRSGKSSVTGHVSVKRKPTRNSNMNPNDRGKLAEDEFMAAAIGDVEWLRQTLRSNRGVINYDKNGLSPIHLSSIHGRLDNIRLLVEKFKVDVNLGSSTGWRPIHLCISNQTGKRSFQCLTYLLEHGADPSAANEDGITPMHQAASEGHVQCLKVLIEVGGVIDGTDQRGHKPIDLAKLWGHRKCARILAAEQWHQDKDFLSKEMKHLQKLKMKQVLEEIEADEEHKTEQQFYGDVAFQDWLSARKLKKGSTGPQGRARQKSASDKTSQVSSKAKSEGSQAGGDNKESLHKANSYQAPPQGGKQGRGRVSPIAERQERGPAQGRRTFSPGPPRDDSATPHDGGSPRENPATPAPPPPARKFEPGFYNDADWNKSTKIAPKTYTTILTDHYPRDEYTMLPKDPPKRAVRDPAALEPVSRQVPAVPRDVVAKVMHPELYERAVVHKCKHIADVHKKHHPPGESLPKAEAGAHLTNDPTSRLFQGALLPARRELSRGSRATPSTAVSGVSAWSGSGSSTSASSMMQSDHMSLANIMARMSSKSGGGFRRYGGMELAAL